MAEKAVSKKWSSYLAVAILLFTLALFAVFSLHWLTDEGGNSLPRTITIYLVAETADSYYLQEVPRKVPEGSALETTAMEELVRGPDPGSDLKPAIPSSVRILGIEVREGTCFLNLSSEIITDAGTLEPCAAREKMAVGSIANTLTSIEGIDEVKLEIEGLQKGTIGNVHVEDLWGYCGLPPVLYRQADLIGSPGLSKCLAAYLPAWKRIDKLALADSLGWGEAGRGSQNGKRIALTFDAGAGGQPTPAILDALKEAGVHSTFFLTGQFVDAYPDVVKRIAEEGHEIANHSNTHPEFPKISPESARKEIAVTEEKIRSLTGISTKPYFRFPYGARTRSWVDFVNGEGYVSIFWTIDTLDWMAETTPDRIRSRVLNNACPGAIVLMHCGSPQEAQALPSLIQGLKSSGYEVVTLSEALSP